MPTLPSFVLAALLGALAPQYPNYGLTDAQVLALGRAKYRDFHYSKAGGSTAAAVECEVIYGQALYRRNSTLEAKLPESKRNVIAGLRRDLSAYCSSLIDVSSSFSGGGTIWSPVRAGIVADVEECLYPILSTQRTKPAPARVVSDVTKVLTSIRNAIEKERTELENYRGSGYGYGFAIDAYKGAANAYASISSQAKDLTRTESDRILEFCRVEARAVLEEAPSEP